MSLSDVAVTSLVLGVVLVPAAAVAIVALVRGYSIQLTVTRPHRRRVDDEGGPP